MRPKIDVDVIPNILGVQFVLHYNSRIDFVECDYQLFTGVSVIILSIQIFIGVTK